MTALDKMAYKLYVDDTGVRSLRWEELDSKIQHFYRQKAMKWVARSRS